MTVPANDVLSITNGSLDMDNSLSGVSSKWVSKCGESQPTKRAIHTHQKSCSICLSMIHSGPTAGREYSMYCGAIIKTRKKASQHFQTCSICQKKRLAIRVTTCKTLIHTDTMRQRYRETAKKTSSRPEIQHARAMRLKQWRDTNPERFDAIRQKAHATPKRSKMEMWLAPHLEADGFVRNARLYCQGTRKQVDFIHWQRQIVIEVDGPWHFLPVRSPRELEKVQKRDHLLEQEIIKRSWRLIRLSMESFRSHTGELISPSLEQLQGMIKDTEWQGIRYFGALYDQRS